MSLWLPFRHQGADSPGTGESFWAAIDASQCALFPAWTDG